MALGLDAVSAKKPAPKKESKESKEEVKGLDGGDDDEILKLVSQEGEKVPVAKKVAVMSELVKTMAEGGIYSLFSSLSLSFSRSLSLSLSLS
jgi:hypothetical protein